MRRTALLLTFLLALGAFALTGCGGSDSDSGASGGSSSNDSSTPASDAAGGSGAVAIAMKDIAFDPSSVTVKVGQKITWTNEDSVQHDVESTSGEKINSDLFGEGGTFSFTPTKAGTIDYVCTVHPGMEGSITVTQ